MGKEILYVDELKEKAPNDGIIVDGLLIQDGTIPSLLKYAEMYMYENSTITPIDTVNVYHGVVKSFVAGLLSGWTFIAGINGAITAFANYGGTVSGTVKATCNNHGLSTGEIVTIAGTTNYNGTYKVTKIDANNFYFTATWVATNTGNFYRGSALKAGVGSAGIYKAMFSCSADSVSNDTLFKFELNVNQNPADNIVSERYFRQGADYSTVPSSGLLTIAEGDYVWLSCKNKTDNSDIYFRHGNISLIKI